MTTASRDAVIKGLFSLIEAQSNTLSELGLEVKALRHLSGLRDDDVKRQIDAFRSPGSFFADSERSRKAALEKIAALLK